METLKSQGFRDKLSTTNEFGKRIRVIPAKVTGKFTRYKSWVHGILVFVFLIVPWLKISENPVLQLDVIHRKFYLFGHLFLPQDAPGIVFIIGTFVLSIGTLTSVFGRAWCGWACPQTVYIEGFFRRVEQWIEGDHLAQRKLEQSNWNLDKVFKRTAKWLVFLLGTLVITHSFLAYFVGADHTLEMLNHSPFENPGAFALVVISTSIILLDFGWFREQFCLVACPYGRLQSVLMDEGSYTIAYDTNRSDCIDCKKCVQVCPTGIDIRNGLQMECIACTACADVCDSVMRKIKKPTGLVRYESESGLRGRRLPILRTRVKAYLGMLVIMLGGLIYRVNTQEVFQTETLRAVDFPYQLVRSESGAEQVINHFKVNWYNLSGKPTSVSLAIPQSLQNQGIELIQSESRFTVNSGDKRNHQFFIKFPKEFLSNGLAAKITLLSIWKNENETLEKNVEVKLVGPGISH